MPETFNAGEPLAPRGTPPGAARDAAARRVPPRFGTETPPDFTPPPGVTAPPDVTPLAPRERLLAETVPEDGPRAGRTPRGPKPPRPPRAPRPERPRRGGFGVFSVIGRLFGFFMALGMLALVVGGVAAYGMYQRYSADLPSIDSLRSYEPKVMSRVYAGDGELLAELATERRIFVPISAIPPLVKQAFISAEDQNFYSHKGVDPVAILRAGLTDLAQFGQGRHPEGASTITQQVAKNMLVGNEVSLARKIREALLALRIEHTLSKDQILELYLNQIYLGLQAYGVAAAAQAYFNKSLDELTIPEAAFLAALPKAPNNYNPFRFPEAARARRDFVIDRLEADHAITHAQATAARAAPIAPSSFHRPETLPGADYFAEEVRRWLVDTFGAERTTQGGLVVRTTLDPTLQIAADRALRDGLMKYDRLHGGWRGPYARMDVTANFRTGWAQALAAAPKPPGILPEWRAAVVLEVTDSEARLGFLDRPDNAGPQIPATPRVLPVLLSDVASWARPARNGVLGPAPRKMGELVKVGDVVMAQIIPASPAGPGRAPAHPERMVFRQIPQVQGALVSLDPATGRVLALSGGWSFENSQFDRATQANRQPGSSFKPFVYLTALQAGISPSQRFLDAPFVVDQGAAGKWRPSNYEMDFSGPVPLRVALEKSLNLVTVRVADRIGMEAVARNAIAFHMVDNMPRVLPAALGAVDTTVIREAGAYASLATLGREVIPRMIDSVQDRTGKVIWRADTLSCACGDPSKPPVITDPRKQIADPQSVYQLINMMEGVVTRGTGTPAVAGLNRIVAGKTGTTQDFQDAWFSGFTPDLATSVWIGFDNPATLGNNQTGGELAGPVWHDYMAVALKNRPKLNFIQPPGVTLAQWDSGSGTVTDAFKPGQVPGASVPMGPLSDGLSDQPTDGPPKQAAAVDSGLGGLY
jgi:penicillin-binding protein 1A